MTPPSFDQLFEIATGFRPYPYQRALALRDELPDLVDVATGLGKTQALVLAWVWRRRFAAPELRAATPRRLVYTLPMRTLVEQTADVVRAIVDRLETAGLVPKGSIGLDVLMGGRSDDGWAARPEADRIVVGTQDMLLSRALNRGYAMSRYLWPVHFALLNNDALWVMDETQLMGAGLPTTAQLAGLRKRLRAVGPVHSLWMSATLDDEQLATIDNPPPSGGWRVHRLGDADRDTPEVARRLSATKNLTVEKNVADEKALASLVAERHVRGTLTLVVVNQVERARLVHQALQKAGVAERTALLHSRFRPPDRAQALEVLFGEGDRIVVATQVVEAGVDVSARTLVTDLAPWSSLVQRFGRCNRGGEMEAADAVVIDTSDDDKRARPYSSEQLTQALTLLSQTEGDVGPDRIRALRSPPSAEVLPVLRRRDLLELFDTTADLAGQDLDVSRYVRGGDDVDIEVFWRDVEKSLPDDLPAPSRDELCRVPVGLLRDFVKKTKEPAWRWSPLDGTWVKAEASELRPGQRVLLPLTAGGYAPDQGWTGQQKDVPAVLSATDGASLESLDDEHRTFVGRWVSLEEHSGDVRREAESLVDALDAALNSLPKDAVVDAALWHDLGKAHPAFQGALGRDAGEPPQAKSPSPSGRVRYRYVASKAGDGQERWEERPGFRHELASALAFLSARPEHPHADLVAYLVAAHHGKVRLSLRALPVENEPPDPSRRFARGVWDGDALPEVRLATDVVAPETRLSLALMELGLGEGGPSWAERVLRLRDEFGPFTLAYLETLVRVADWRASAKEQTR